MTIDRAAQPDAGGAPPLIAQAGVHKANEMNAATARIAGT